MKMGYFNIHLFLFLISFNAIAATYDDLIEALNNNNFQRAQNKADEIDLKNQNKDAQNLLHKFIKIKQNCDRLSEIIRKNLESNPGKNDLYYLENEMNEDCISKNGIYQIIAEFNEKGETNLNIESTYIDQLNSLSDYNDKNSPTKKIKLKMKNEQFLKEERIKDICTFIRIKKTAQDLIKNKKSLVINSDPQKLKKAIDESNQKINIFKQKLIKDSNYYFKDNDCK
jgi:hypothetical protein